MNPDPYRVAAIQFEPASGDKAANIAALVNLTEAADGVRLIVLPEMVTTGNCWESQAEIAPFVEPVPGPTTERFAAIPARYACYLAVGLPEMAVTTPPPAERITVGIARR